MLTRTDENERDALVVEEERARYSDELAESGNGEKGNERAALVVEEAQRTNGIAGAEKGNEREALVVEKVRPRDNVERPQKGNERDALVVEEQTVPTAAPPPSHPERSAQRGVRGAAHWLPFTQMSTFNARTRTFASASGTTLTDTTGHQTFDAISSVWTTIHGHSHPHIVEAISRQASTLDHATSLGATNPVADELAERLCALTGHNAAFFASDGASAIEAALKMAVQYHQLTGNPQRTRFIRLRDAYHGDTAGAMSVSGIQLFRTRFRDIIIESLCYDDAPEALSRNDIAAVIVEPRVQAAAGMRIVASSRYENLRSNPHPLLIVDEIATGFGRTGTMFAYEQLALTPDIVCLGKGITGGALALSAVLASAQIYEAFLGNAAEARQLFHGHSYAGNPIACAAALASLELFEREHTLANVAALDAQLHTILAPLRTHALVAEIRRAGLMCGIELTLDPAATWQVANAMYDRGHFTRPIGATIQLVPPLSSTREELTAFAESLIASLNTTTA
jgi:adenosylmethionine-8-amino-7-oxononanoate aminotransferase